MKIYAVVIKGENNNIDSYFETIDSCYTDKKKAISRASELNKQYSATISEEDWQDAQEYLDDMYLRGLDNIDRADESEFRHYLDEFDAEYNKYLIEYFQLHKGKEYTEEEIEQNDRYYGGEITRTEIMIVDLYE